MIRLNQILQESITEKTGQQVLASKIAKNMGLVSKGWGRWADPQTGKVVAKTIDGKLVKVQPSDDPAANVDANDPTVDPYEKQKAYNTDRNYDSARGEKQMARKLDPATSKAPEQMNRFERNKATYDKYADHILKNATNLDDQEYEKAGTLLRKIISSRPDVKVDPELVNDGFGPDEMAMMYKFIDDTANGHGGLSIPVVDSQDREGTIDVDELNHDVWSNIDFAKDGSWTYNPPPAEPDYYDVEDRRDRFY